MAPVWLCSCDMPGLGCLHTPGMLSSTRCRISLAKTLRFGRKAPCSKPRSKPDGFAADTPPRSSRSLLAEGGGDFQHPARPLLEATSRWSHVIQHGQGWVKSHARILRASPAADGSSGRPAGTAGENRAGPEPCWEGGYRTGEPGGSGAVPGAWVPDGRTGRTEAVLGWWMPGGRTRWDAAFPRCPGGSRSATAAGRAGRHRWP